MPDISTALNLLEKPIAAVAAVATGKTREVLARVRANQNIKLLYQKLNASQKVKTLWAVDRPIAISSFYFPAKLKSKSGVLQQINRLDELPTNAVVLSGIVGQGKSILLRYLLGKEIRSGTRVPLFIELRRIPPIGLTTFVIDMFGELMGTIGHPEVFQLFATNGKISFLLDGFDEIDPDKTQEVVVAIEELAVQYASCRLVVTSRPNSGIENSPLFDVIPIAPLNEADFSGFFHKLLPRDRELAQRLTTAVSGSSPQVRQLANTPLLATQLTIVYRAIQRIPSDFTEFYDELFSILLVRHDTAKKGWERRRKTSLTDREIQQAFEAYSFKSKAVGLSSLPRTQALNIAAAALASSQLTCNEGHFLTDIEKVTCLLQNEGGRIEFLHQSVQEYFSARYVSSRPEDVAKRFYAYMLTDKRWQNWEQVLRFLAQIDKHRSSVHFFIPALRETIAALQPPPNTSQADHARSVVAGTIGVLQAMKKPDGTPYSGPRYQLHTLSERTTFRAAFIDSKLFDTLFGTGNITRGKWPALFDKTTHGQYLTYAQIADGVSQRTALDKCIEDSISAIRRELASHIERVRMLEDSGKFMGLQSI